MEVTGPGGTGAGKDEEPGRGLQGGRAVVGELGDDAGPVVDPTGRAAAVGADDASAEPVVGETDRVLADAEHERSTEGVVAQGGPGSPVARGLGDEVAGLVVAVGGQGGGEELVGVVEGGGSTAVRCQAVAGVVPDEALGDTRAVVSPGQAPEFVVGVGDLRGARLSRPPHPRRARVRLPSGSWKKSHSQRTSPVGPCSTRLSGWPAAS